MEALRECVIARASQPRNPVAVALSLNMIGAKSINVRARDGKSVGNFARRYAKRLNTLLRLDVGREDFSLFRGGAGRTFALSCQTSTCLGVPDREHDHARATRPASLIQGDVGSHKAKSPAGAMRRRNSKPVSVSTMSPRVNRTVHVGATISSRSSVAIARTAEPPVAPVCGG